jgi:hypothetical protein
VAERGNPHAPLQPAEEVVPSILLVLIAASAAYAHELLLLVDRPASLLKARTPSPRPPFLFVREDHEGSTPKVFIRDGRGALWNVKFGEEVKAEVFATKLVAALGYYSDVSQYVGRGRILASFCRETIGNK